MIFDTLINNENVSCSWATSVPDSIVGFGETEDPKEWDEDGGIVHVIKEENFLYLEKLEEKPCFLYIKLNDNYTQITNVSVVSEAKIIEIYGKYGEYIKTCKCEHISERNNVPYYAAQTDLLTTQEITFKFPGVKDGMWLCGIKILVRKAPPSITNSFDYNLVDDKLKKSNIPISEKAEEFKKFLHEYATNKYKSATKMDPHVLLKMMEREAISHLNPVTETASRNITKYLTNLIPSSMNATKTETEERHDERDSKDSDRISTQNLKSSIQEYVDESIQKLEEKMQETFKKQLEDLEAKQNEKLDTILNLLQNSVLR